MLRPQGWGRRGRRSGPLACLVVAAGLLAGGSALAADDTISTVAGNGSAAFAGDGGAATVASLKAAASVASTSDGGYLIADTENNRIRRVAPDGTITTVAGNGSAGYNGDGIAATSAALNKPQGVASLLDGGFLIADTDNDRVRRVTPLGTIDTVAGSGSSGYDGDGGLATDAELDRPRAAVPTLDGGFMVADTENHVVRRVSALGLISTAAGTGSDGYDGDGGAATAARLDAPDDVAPTTDGGFLIADRDKDVVRRVSALGIISTVAGNTGGDGDGPGLDVEGGLATETELEEPGDVAPLVDGGFLIADQGADKVHRVRADGILVPFAGSPSGGGFFGDGGPALAAKLDGPSGLSVTPEGDLLIADALNNRIRRVNADLLLPALGPQPGGPPDPQPAGEGPGPGEAQPESVPESVPEPVLGVAVVVTPGFGQVLVKQPGEDRFAPLQAGTSLPVGSLVDARKGSVVLESALSGEGNSQTGTFWDGIFQVRQARGGDGMTDIVLRGGNFGSCRKARLARPLALSSSRKRRPVRRLWAKDDHGRFRTHGRDSVATTRGTVWSTADRCKGTLTRVREGQVHVRNRHNRRSVLVSAGERYLARSPR